MRMQTRVNIPAMCSWERHLAAMLKWERHLAAMFK